MNTTARWPWRRVARGGECAVPAQGSGSSRDSRIALVGLVARMAVCAGGAVLASCASTPVAPTPGAEYRPAPLSALVTRRDMNHLMAQWQEGDVAHTVLARERPGAEPQPVAWLTRARTGEQWHVSVQPLALHWAAADRAAHETAALEQLYSLVFRMEPQGRYCLGTGLGTGLGNNPVPCDAAREIMTHAQALQALAQLRERSALRSTDAVAWQRVALQAAPVQTWDADLAAVQVRGPEGPLQGLAIHFNRAPHSICSARTGADGVARCRLQDQHSDGHQHDHATAVVVTFAGDLRPDRVLLPTTHVLQGAAAATLPPFARPLLALPPSPP